MSEAVTRAAPAPRPADASSSPASVNEAPGSGDRVVGARIVGMRVDGVSVDRASDLVAAWARQGASRSVCVATVNNVMEAYDDPRFAAAMNRADLVTPDGMPLVWGLRALGVRDATRTTGAQLVPAILHRAAELDIPVGLYGGTPDVLAILRARAEERSPGLRVAFAYSPPFRALSPAEEQGVIEGLIRSDARIVLVGLGCPKQELWMEQMRGRIPAVMIGVGAAFDFIAGRKRRAPRWVQHMGLEWLFRLASEPRRLWRRYLKQNPRFVLLLAHQMLMRRRDRDEPSDERQVT